MVSCRRRQSESAACSRRPAALRTKSALHDDVAVVANGIVSKSQAIHTAKESAANVVWLATEAPRDGITGAYVRVAYDSNQSTVVTPRPYDNATLARDIWVSCFKAKKGQDHFHYVRGIAPE